jgi:glutamate dehydrogenase
VPRDRFDSAIRIAIGRYLASAYNGASRRSIRPFPRRVRWRVCTSSSRASPARTPNPERGCWKSAIEQLVRTWTDALAEALTLVHEPIKAQAAHAPLPATLFPVAIARPMCRRSRSRISG